MELAGVAERFHSRTVLITGATGFIAKLLVEKILRLQPGVKRLYLLVRAADQVSANRRVESEIMQLPIFQPLREKYQTHFSSWFWDKVFPLAGDVSLKNFGIGDARLAEDIRKETNIIVHMAATVNFAERYDTALAINTMGVKHMIDFASKCTNLELVLLVSTAYVNLMKQAYVNLMKQGIMMEKPLQQWRSYDGRSDLDISEEMAFKDEKLKELVYNNASERTIRHTMKKIGAQRAKKFGWANAYVFTKAMGEMLAYEQNSRLPIVIIRPSATTSTWKEPFPGWIEGAKAIDTWITNYGKGTLKFFPTDVATVIDIVPADIVVNAMLCIISYHPQGTADFIYQIGSSMSNPIKLGQMSQTTYKYFSQIPFVGAKGDVVKVKQPNFLATMASFYETMDKHYKMPLQDMLRRGLSTTEDRHIYNHLKREYDFTVAVAEVYWPFTISKTRFDDSKMQNLMGMVTERDRELIPCNIKFINWDKYFMETHIPGVMDYESRELTRARL
ncbi:fatty acyl-CoA reductase 1 isoform X1 [Oryza sativa Japonica Group]|uniref:fatty acyl-CoA reductase 1 isoform X1 n=1 Tax=Oryza sativa subsp. japonica TaxID=39947 RepID=UPI0007754B98|nr:fatty acyl-CoA reductase 1 isoform X1 [Oryza sativa Japonica Group]